MAEEIKITTEFIKLEQLLKLSGAVQTGGMAKEAVLSGEVLVNGEACLQRGKKLVSGDTVSFMGCDYIVK